MSSKVLGFDEFKDFLAGINHKLQAFVFEVMDSSLEAKVNDLVNSEMLVYKERREIFVPFEGMEIVSFKVNFLLGAGYPDFETKHHGMPNFKVPDIEGIKVLGTHEGKDLYICPQNCLPETLIAKYGDGDHEYVSFNPEILGLTYQVIADLGGIRLEMYKRAVSVDANFKFKSRNKGRLV